MSTFSGISTALSSLIAQRQALDVAGQNVANANTAGYTRQRADMAAVRAGVPSLWSATSAIGNGVTVTSIERLGDVFLDARLRTETSASAYQTSRATSLATVESAIREPSDKGLSKALATYWADWQDVANKPDDLAARKVLLGDAQALVSQIGEGYRKVDTQWTQLRTDSETLVTHVNSTAKAIADLNDQIRSIAITGGNANELIDQRSSYITQLSGLVGATATERADGTMDVMVAGNALVRGGRAEQVALQGAWTMAAGIGQPPATLDQVKLVWAANGTQVDLDGGTLAGNVADLGPSGAFADAAGQWNTIATSLATTVNAVHTTGQTLQKPATAGGPFFALAAGVPAATGLSVAITDAKDIAAADPTKGALDGSIADKIGKLAKASGGPDELWSSFVVDLGVRSKAATQRATVLEASRSSAEKAQLSSASVDLDEESVNMLAYQRAYEGAARVLTAIDEMLDTLINRTGVVGR
jgi:flagellar hook-associated protein 1 FlgK